MEQSMKLVFKRFVRDESGATAIEYGLIAAGIAVAIIAVADGFAVCGATRMPTRDFDFRCRR
jgi:Flp pilus assembly pilin Flp